MNQYNENYKDTGSKSAEHISRDAYIVNRFSVSANGKGTGFRHEYAFIVSKSRGRGVLSTVRNQCSDGNEIKTALLKAEQNHETLNHARNSWSKPVKAAKKRLDDLTYLNSLLDSCFKGWH